MSQRILVVDDERHIRVTLRMCLEADGFVVDEAADGEEAVRKALANRPSLILLDLAMPKLTGTGVIEQLGEAGSRIPVVIMTAHGMVMAIRGMLLGAAGFLEKPLTPETVRDAVNRHILPETTEADDAEPPLAWLAPAAQCKTAQNEDRTICKR